jgi:L-iditol 2-dehydrogenase
VAVPVWNLLELPDTVSCEAAAMLEPMAVAVHVMRRTLPGPGDRVAVCGLGTIGMLLVMFLREAGVTDLYVIGNKAFQRERIVELGLAEETFCDSRTENAEEWLLRQTGGAGVDVFYECVGKPETIAQAIRAAAPAAAVQLVGNPASDIRFDRDTYWRILRNQLTVRGSWNSSFMHDADDDWHYVLERLEDGRICPERFITQRFSFAQLAQGLCIMRDKTEEYLKVMIIG